MLGRAVPGPQKIVCRLFCITAHPVVLDRLAIAEQIIEAHHRWFDTLPAEVPCARRKFALKALRQDIQQRLPLGKQRRAIATRHQIPHQRNRLVKARTDVGPARLANSNRQRLHSFAQRTDLMRDNQNLLGPFTHHFTEARDPTPEIASTRSFFHSIDLGYNIRQRWNIATFNHRKSIN